MTAKRKIEVTASAAIAITLAVLGVQYARHSWPFAAAEIGRAKLPGNPSHGGSHDAHAAPARADSGTPPPGYVPVTIDAARAAALNLSTIAIEERAFTRALRTVGVVVLDETRTAHVHVKVRGWIDTIFVDFVGRKVKDGEPLCSIYSQDVYAAEVEFLSLLERAEGRPSPDPLLEAARRRLALWDVPASEVERLEATRKARRTFPLRAPRAGTVVAKEALDGMYVDPSIELYTLSDLSRVWVLADVYETDVPYVHAGDKAKLAVEGREAPVDATVSFLYPTIDEPSRTRKVRFLLDNRNGRLLPGAFVTVTMDVPLGTGVAVPENAVIRTGIRSIVFVAHGEQADHLEPREVTLGPLVGRYYRVDRGLAPGERIATGAQFLLDSESRLRATSTPGGGHAH